MLWRRRARFIPLTLALCAFVPAVSDGAFTTSITSDGSLPAPTSVSQAANVYNINGGTMRGSNLFHSFGLFSVGTGDIASFNGPSGIVNILSRVTGGQQSMIDGQIRSTILGANLYLMNPAGLVFGPNATLNVSGSFHVTTADYVRMADGAKFYADITKPSILSVASIAAFGFLSNTVGDISLQGSTLVVGSGQALLLVGGNVQMVGGSLSAPAGYIGVVSQGSPSETSAIALGQINNTQVDAMPSGRIVLSQGATLDTSGTSGGTIVLKGGRLEVADSYARTNTLAAGQGGGIFISTPVFEMHGGQINADTYNEGNAGNISINVRTLNLEAGAVVSSGSFGNGQSGNISITATDSVVVQGHASGSLTIGPLVIRNNLSSVETGSFAQGGAGIIAISTPLLIVEGGSVNSSTFSKESSGGIVIDVGQLHVTAGGIISSTTFGEGHGGTVQISASNSVMISGQRSGAFTFGDFVFENDPSFIGTSTLGKGAAGNLSITVPNLMLSDRGIIAGGTGSDGPGGQVVLNVDRLTLNNGGQIINGSVFPFGQSLFLGSGKAGDITITATDSIVSQNSAITTQTTVADGGNITIRAGELVQLIHSNITTSVGTGSGNGGNITIDPQFVILQSGSQILANAFGGNGGNIHIVAGLLLISPDSVINASSALGVSGTITINAAISDLSGSLAPLPQEFLRTSVLLRSRCAARVGGSHSSFVVAGREAIPMEPGGLLPSPIYKAGETGMAGTSPGEGVLVALNLATETLDAGCAQ